MGSAEWKRVYDVALGNKDPGIEIIGENPPFSDFVNHLTGRLLARKAGAIDRTADEAGRMARGGREKQRIEPERRCIATRESQPKAGLIRFVIAPDGDVTPDLAERLPGRGIWVSAERGALERAVARGLFARAAKRQARAAPDLAERVEALLASRLVDLIALARKAGEAVAGLEKTKAALVAGEAALLIQAADGSERGRNALRPPGGEDTLVSCLFRHELGLAFARDNVIHAAVLGGGLAERVKDEARRLSGVRTQPGTGEGAAETAGTAEEAGG